MSNCIECVDCPVDLDTWIHIRIADNNIEAVRKVSHDLVDIIATEHSGRDRLMDLELKVCLNDHINVRFIDNPEREGYILDSDDDIYRCNIEFIAKPFKVYNMFKEFKIQSVKSQKMNFDIFDITEVNNLGDNLARLSTSQEHHDLINKVKVVSL